MTNLSVTNIAPGVANIIRRRSGRYRQTHAEFIDGLVALYLATIEHAKTSVGSQALLARAGFDIDCRQAQMAMAEEDAE